jgi:hypothetical protein
LNHSFHESSFAFEGGHFSMSLGGQFFMSPDSWTASSQVEVVRRPKQQSRRSPAAARQYQSAGLRLKSSHVSIRAI